jgi:hypothetical protein
MVVFLEANGRFDQNTNGSRKGRSAVDNAMLVQMAAELVILEGRKLLGVLSYSFPGGYHVGALGGGGRGRHLARDWCYAGGAAVPCA